MTMLERVLPGDGWTVLEPVRSASDRLADAIAKHLAECSGCEVCQPLRQKECACNR